MKKSNKLVTRSLLLAVVCAGTGIAVAQAPTPGQNQTGNTTQRDSGAAPNQNYNNTTTQTDQYRQTQTQPGQPNSNQRQTQTSDQYRNPTADSTYRSSTPVGSVVVTKANKASSLIGMNVKNQNGENLGEIKDIVISLDQEKVSYAVLQTGIGVMGTGKYHAVPLRAFRASSDNNHLILNADKDKLARAEGFDKDNWPSLGSPVWGAEPFWQDSSPMKGTGSQYNQGTTGNQGTRGDGTRRDAPQTGTH